MTFVTTVVVVVVVEEMEESTAVAADSKPADTADTPADTPADRPADRPADKPEDEEDDITVIFAELRNREEVIKSEKHSKTNTWFGMLQLMYLTVRYKKSNLWPM